MAMQTVAPTVTKIRQALRAHATPARAKSSQWFFKTKPGQYGHGDRFIGVSVPDQRLVAKRFTQMSLSEVLKLLHSQVHEERLTALILLVNQFERSKDQAVRKKIYQAYLANTRWINNWDLVDTSAPKIVGAFLGEQALPVLRRLAHSKNLWERRIAMIATQYQINQGDAQPALEIAEIVLHDQHDLMHKATGWMLREVGIKCSQPVLEKFLRQHAANVPRTALRYAIEKFPKTKQQFYLKYGQ